MSEKAKQRKIEILEWLIALNVGLILFLLFTQFFVLARIEGDSMNPTYTDQEFVLGNKYTNNIQSNDVIAFASDNGNGDSVDNCYEELESISNDDELIEETKKCDQLADDNEEYHIKRVIGVPGDEIRLVEDELYLNGELVIDQITPVYPTEEIIILGEDEYYVIGDNYGASNDSRYHGPIIEDDIFAKIVLDRDNQTDFLSSPDEQEKIDEKVEESDD